MNEPTKCIECNGEVEVSEDNEHIKKFVCKHKPKKACEVWEYTIIHKPKKNK